MSVIIPIYRDWERLSLCLDALGRQTLPRDRLEIIIANNEPDGTVGPAQLPTNARMIQQPRAGSYAARNAAVAAARGRFLAFTDSDCIPGPRWLEHGVALLGEEPGVRLTGPITIFRERGAGYLAYLYEYHTAFYQQRWAARGVCATANLLVSREVFDRVGPFEEGLVSGGDTQWGERAAAAGIPIRYEEGLEILHPARRTLAEIFKRRRRVAGSEARRKQDRTLFYVLFRLLPPFRSYRKLVFLERRGPITRVESVMLFFVHWFGRIGEAWEFLMVRLGLKQPNRT